jgi:hypothetical protein
MKLPATALEVPKSSPVVSSAAYLKRRALRKALGGSGVLLGRINDPAVGEADKQRKYLMPW